MESEWLSTGWKALVSRGALAVVFGVLAMTWPLETATALALLWGIWAVADGIGALAQAFWPGAGAESGVRWLLGAMGVLALVVGILAITSPQLTAVALTWLLGIWLIARAVFELMAAAMSHLTMHRGLLALVGLLDLVLGLLFVVNPGKSVVGIAVLLGVIAVVWGATILAVGLWVRHEETGYVGPAGAGPRPVA